MSPDTEPGLVDNAAEHRYELWVGDERAGVIEYGVRPGVVEVIHTEIDPAFEGRGLGTRLMAGALDDIRARGLELIPTCPFPRVPSTAPGTARPDRSSLRPTRLMLALRNPRGSTAGSAPRRG